MPGLVDKGLSVTRSGTKKASLELALLYVEVENTADGVMVSHKRYSRLPTLN